MRFLQSLELTDAAKIAQKERIDGPTLISLVRLYDHPIDRTIARLTAAPGKAHITGVSCSASVSAFILWAKHTKGETAWVREEPGCPKGRPRAVWVVPSLKLLP